MAERRMFSKKITDSDSFIELSSASQALYFHLNQGADDDGFTNKVQEAMWKAHASTDDLKVLLTKNFIIRFESGVIVIKHWRMHNTLRKDRYAPTNFQEEFKLLHIKDTKAYTLDPSADPAWLPDGCQTVATDKDRLDKNNISSSIACAHACAREDTSEAPKEGFPSPSSEKENAQIKLSDAERKLLEENISHEDLEHYIEAVITCESKGKVYTNKTHYQAICAMALKDGRYGKHVKAKQPKNNDKSYDLDEFFEAALRHTFDDFDNKNKED